MARRSATGGPSGGRGARRSGAAGLRFAALAALAVAVATPVPSSGQPWTEVDRVLASVGGQTVTLSDLELERDLGLLEAPAGQSGTEALLPPYLDRLLILREVAEVGGYHPDPGLEESAYEGFVAAFGTAEAYRARLAAWGIDEEEARRRLRESLLASLYTESRIRFFIRVMPEDVEKAYQEDPARWGGGSLYESWNRVQETLEAEAFRAERARWLESLRARYRLEVVARPAEAVK